jgi:hypothetical protein
MPEGPLGSPRPATNSTLLLVIKETPVPESDSEGVLPGKLAITEPTENNITRDIANRTMFGGRDISVDRKSSFTRGLGQSDTYKIRLDVSGEDPASVNKEVEKLVEEGYSFTSTKFE